MPMTALEAVDLIRFAELYAERLGAATAEFSGHADYDREKAWLHTASHVVDEARRPGPALIERARRLPELTDLREEFAEQMLGAWVDGLEKLLAGITFHVSGRAPIIEALFPHQKFPVLRKSPREAVEKYHRDFEKRLKSGYVSRMLGTEDFAFAHPVLAKLQEIWAEYQSCFDATGPAADEAAAIRAELSAVGDRIDVAIKQARLLAEAAMTPVPGAFEASQLSQKPKKRSGKGVEPVAVPPEVTAASAEAASADETAAAPPTPDADPASGDRVADGSDAVASEPGADAAVAEPAAQAAAEPEMPASPEAAAADAAPAEAAPASIDANAPAPTAQVESSAAAAPAPAEKKPRKKKAAAQAPKAETPESSAT